MRRSLSFALTLHRVFDSEPPKTKALFYADNRQLFPVEKPKGLYVFLDGAESPLAVVCNGFMYSSVNAEQSKVTPVTLYPDKLLVVPAGWRLVRGRGKSDSLVYVVDSLYEPKLTEHSPEKGFARIRSRKGFTGGCLLFGSGDKKEIALVLEKQSPDIFYLSKLTQDYTGGTLRRVYCARTNADGEFYLAVPEDFAFTDADCVFL